MIKKCTIFCDIDGTIFEYRKFETYQTSSPTIVENVKQRLLKANEEGHCIVLTTARPEYLRDHTLIELQMANIPFHQLVMGIERGTRILINDMENPEEKRAYGINLLRNEGFSDKDLELLDNIL